MNASLEVTIALGSCHVGKKKHEEGDSTLTIEWLRLLDYEFWRMV
jgi:hypothetical protein